MQPLPTPFDRRLSLALDRIILALEATTDPASRAWLRWAKLMTEPRVARKAGRQ